MQPAFRVELSLLHTMQASGSDAGHEILSNTQINEIYVVK